jgi:hypothetical protein
MEQRDSGRLLEIVSTCRLGERKWALMPSEVAMMHLRGKKKMMIKKKKKKKKKKKEKKKKKKK